MVKLKKISKKKLKEPDEFITSTEQAYLFVRDHSKPIAIGGIVLVVFILSIFIPPAATTIPPKSGIS